MTRRSAIWLLPLALALHNLEEGVFFPRYLRRVLGMLPADARDWIGPVSSQQMAPALLLATIIPLGFSRPRGDALGPDLRWVRLGL